MKLRLFISTLLLFLAFSVFSQVPERPDPPKLYNDLSGTNFITQSDALQIEQRLEEFYHSTSNQICIVIVDDLKGMDASQFAFGIGNKWGVGTEKFNNGIVILIKPTGGEGQRDLFIAVGYGLEGAIPDLATKSIRENEMTPHLKNGDYYGAIVAAIDALEKASKGEYDIKVDRVKNFFEKYKLLLAILFLIFAWYISGKGNKGNYSGRGYSGSMYRGSSFGGSSSSSGGGFGGFGGGSFGGGGSGGKW